MSVAQLLQQQLNITIGNIKGKAAIIQFSKLGWNAIVTFLNKVHFV